MRGELGSGSADDDEPLSDDSLDGDAPMEDDSLLRAIAAAPTPRLRTWLPPGTLIGTNYRIESKLGAGAMGTVYAASDLALDRRVAIKLHANAQADAQTSRMWREAKAMARLQDPHVVAVHEVGVHEGRVYIAMELVEGSSAKEWLATPHGWREILEVFIQAARGLAAAHRVGLVHRDFKPANLLIEHTAGGIGRVRVADFGLARAASEGEASTSGSSGLSSGSGPAFDQRMTQTGVAVGTPAYMAPEQHAGRVDHRSDQYAFFVTLYEALYGVRPFPGETVAEVVTAARAGEVHAAPVDRPVPPWLRQVVLRGLRAAPEQRHVDMDAVVHALQSDPTRRRRTQIAVAGGIGVMGGLLGVIVHLAGRAQGGPDCDAQAAAIDGSWNDDARARVHDAVSATEVAYADDTWSRIEPEIDGWAQGWSDAARSACTRADVSLGDRLHEAQLLCLAHRRQAFDALLEVLVAADAKTVERAVTAVAALPAVESCSDVDRLAADVEPPTDPELASAVEQVRATLSRARALDQAGAPAAGLTVAEGALAEARALAWPPLLAEALLVHGVLAQSAGKFDIAEPSLRESYAEAIASGDDGVATDAASRLTLLVGQRLSRPDAGLEWGYHATALLRRVGLGDRRETLVLDNLAAVHRFRGELDRALELYERSLAISEATLGPEHPDLARTLSSMGDVRRERAEYALALQLQQRALTIRERVHGPGHPAVANALLAMMSTHFESGDTAKAIEVGRRVLAIRESALGADHPDVAAALANLGSLLEREGAYDEAMSMQQRALAIDLATLGEHNANVAITLENIGNIHLARGNYGEAESFYRRALEIRESVLGPEHPHVAITLVNLALVLDELERKDESIASHRRALAINEKALGAEHPKTAESLEHLGNAELFAGQLEQSLAHHQHALAIRTAVLPPTHLDFAESHTNLGNTLEELGRWDEALAEHERALAILVPQVDTHNPRLALAHYNLGQVYLGLRRNDDAVAAFERSLVLREPLDTAPAFLADVRFELARALVIAGGDRERALELAEAARDGYGPTPSEQRLRAKVVAWLSSQRLAKRR